MKHHHDMTPIGAYGHWPRAAGNRSSKTTEHGAAARPSHGPKAGTAREHDAEVRVRYPPARAAVFRPPVVIPWRAAPWDLLLHRYVFDLNYEQQIPRSLRSQGMTASAP